MSPNIVDTIFGVTSVERQRTAEVFWPENGLAISVHYNGLVLHFV